MKRRARSNGYIGLRLCSYRKYLRCYDRCVLIKPSERLNGDLIVIGDELALSGR